MIYLRIALLYLLCLPFRLCAQDVIYSEYEKFDFHTGEYAVVGMAGGMLYNYHSTSDGPVLEAYDDSMNKVAQVILDFFPEKIYETHFITYPDKIIVLYQALESNKVVQYAALLDEKGRLKNKPMQLGSFKTGIFGATKTYFQSAVSENKKTILVYSINDKGNIVDFDGKWLDDNLAITKKSHATFQAENTVQHADLSIDNDGNIYVPAYTPIGNMNYADQFWILKLIPGASKFETSEMRLDTKFAASGYIKIDNTNKRLYFGGFYADRKNGGFDGIVYASYDITRDSFLTRKFIPFDRELIDAANARNKKHPFDNYQVQHLIVKNDGGFVLVAEVHYITSRSNYAPGMGFYSFYSPYTTTIVHEYHFNDIMALSYDKDGTRQWNAFVPKEQYSQEDGGLFSSYALLNSGGTLAFIFNDFNPSQSRIKLATLSADGQKDIRSFTAEGNDDPDWMPSKGKQVAGRILIVPCLHKKQICFAKVVF